LNLWNCHSGWCRHAMKMHIIEFHIVLKAYKKVNFSLLAFRGLNFTSGGTRCISSPNMNTWLSVFLDKPLFFHHHLHLVISRPDFSLTQDFLLLFECPIISIEFSGGLIILVVRFCFKQS